MKHFLLAILLFAGAPSLHAQSAEITKVLEAYQRAYNAKDANALVALYADDGYALPPGREIVKGKADLVAFWSKAMGGTLRLTPVLAKANGDTGYIVGRFGFPEHNNDPATIRDMGKFVVTLSKLNNVWRITSDTWNSDGERRQ